LYNLSDDEFVLSEWEFAGLNVPTAVKRGITLIDVSVVMKTVGTIGAADQTKLSFSLKRWLEIE